MNVQKTHNSSHIEKTSQNGSVYFLDFKGDDEALLKAIKNSDNGAKRALYERYAKHVERVILRIMGVDDEIPDLISETFVQAYKSIHTVKNAPSLKAWISRVAVFVSRGRIRQRKRRRMFMVFTGTEQNDKRTTELDIEGREALIILYRLLDELSADERIVFALRFIDGRGFIEMTEICNVSRATLNRRLDRAQAKFLDMAKGEPVLADWIKRGTRWQI
ncbi:MAG: RNA polymerase sigma factor [Deltaproteobacteria bacterium]|nr:RNA polymerase sigma factor [Deltaproteobacteria bacterium]